jgi:hypothetical protein
MRERSYFVGSGLLAWAVIAACNIPDAMFTKPPGDAAMNAGDPHAPDGPDPQTPDGAEPIDDATAPDPDPGPTIQIAGTIREAGTANGAAGATVDVIRSTDRVQLGTTISDADGNYAVTVPTHDAPVDAYLDVSYPDHLRTRAYLIPQLTVDSPPADAIVFSRADLQAEVDAAGASLPVGSGFILAQLFESNQPAAGATAAVTPSVPVYYTDPSTDQPGNTQTATATDGLVWIFAVQPGVASVSARLADHMDVQPRQVSVEANLVIQIGLEPPHELQRTALDR